MYYHQYIGNEFMLVRNFNRQFSAIRVEQFGKPKIASIAALEFPRSSIFHFLPNGTDCLGPEQSLPYLAKAEKLMYARHHLKYNEASVQGRPLPLVRQDLNAKLLTWHRANRKIRPLKDDKLIMQDPRTLMIENYANLPYMYRYQETIMSWHDRYHNIYSTIWNQVGEDIRRYDRNNYIIIELPEVLPSIVDLKRAEVKRDNNTLKNIRTDAQLTFLDMWTWLGNHRERSLLNLMGSEQLLEVNLILKVGNRFTNLNLGELNYWRTGIAGTGGAKRTGNEYFTNDVGTDYHVPESLDQIQYLENVLGLEYFQGDSLGLEGAPESKIKGLLSSLQAQNRLYVTCINLITAAQQGDMVDAVTDQLKAQTDAIAEIAQEATEDEIAAAQQAIGRAPTDEEQVFDEERLKEDLQSYDKLDVDENAEFAIAKPKDTTDQTPQQVAVSAMRPLSPEECVDNACQKYIQAGTLSVKAYDTFKELATTYKRIPNPNGTGMLGDNLEATPEEVTLKEEVPFDDDFIIDKTMTKSKIRNFDRQYVDQVMGKDINNSVMVLQRAGFPILNYEVERITNAANDHNLHTIEVATIKGQPRTTLRVIMPKVDRYGTFRQNNIKYTMRRQRVDLPLRKIGPAEVALTSFYGKHFVSRSGKVVHDYPNWLVSNVRAQCEDPNNLAATGARYGSVFNREVEVPRDYAAMSHSVSQFSLNKITYHFDFNSVNKNFPEQIVKELVSEELLPVGVRGSTYYGMDRNSVVFKLTPNGPEQIGTLPEQLGLDGSKAPYEMATLSVSDKEMPIGVVFSYYAGLTGMLKQFGIEYRQVDPAERVSLADNEFALKLADCKLIISPTTRKQALVANGLRPYVKLTNTFTLKDMNSPEVYQVLVAKDKMKPYYLKELENMDAMFVDPITLRILKARKEPETWKGLLERSVEMICHDAHADEIDIEEQHIYGHQRIVGAMYTELARSVREYVAKPSNGKKRIDISTRAVMDRIMEDGSVAPISDCTPIHAVKQASVVTAGGTGGRSRRSMVKRTRRFSETALGVMSGDGVDNGDAGMTEYLAADAQLGTVDGLISPDIDRNKLNPSQYMSVVAMTAPELYFDDSKRQVFYGIQSASTTSAKGYRRSGLMTGAETLVAHCTSPTQANAAIDAGRVTAIDDQSITITYGTGQHQKVESYPLGRHFGNHEGHIYPHDLVTRFKVGDKVGKGDIVSYNTKFFTPNPFNAKQVDWMMGTIAMGVFLESDDTLEDTNLLGPELSEELASEQTIARDIPASFGQELHNMIKEGDRVSADTILCVIEDAVTAGSDVFSAQSIDTLSALGSRTPKATVTGIVDRIEVYYNGELEDMSDTLRKIVTASDRRRRKASTALTDGVVTDGRVDASMRVSGNPVELGTAVIRVHISYWSPAIGGSKVVFGNQMKSTIRAVSPVTIKSELGMMVKFIFGKVSNDNRIVNSIYRQCAANTDLRLIGEDTLKIIRGQK